MGISRKRAKNIKLIKDKDIDYSEIPELDEDFFKNAVVELPQKKKAISLRVDTDVLQWFKSFGENYQTRINAILKAYMKSFKS